MVFIVDTKRKQKSKGCHHETVAYTGCVPSSLKLHWFGNPPQKRLTVDMENKFNKDEQW